MRRRRLLGPLRALQMSEPPPLRSWFKQAPAQLTGEAVSRWLDESASAYESEMRSMREWRSLEPDDPDDLVAGLTVVVFGAEDGRCLSSLSEQTLDPTLFEVILISEKCAASQVTGDAGSPAIHVSGLEISDHGVGCARNLAAGMARRHFIMFLDGGDTVSPGFLRGMLDSAGRGVAVAPKVMTALGSGHDGVGPMRSPGQAAGLDFTSLGPGAVVSTSLVRNLRWDVEYAGEEETAFWATVVLGNALEVVPASDPAAIYRRTACTPAQEDDDAGFSVAVARSLATISKLEELGNACPGSGAEAVRTAIATIADDLGERLLRHPSRRMEVVEAIDESAVSALPYERINKEPARGLAIAYAFPPYADTSALVTAKRLRIRGEVFDVVQNAMDSIRETDETSLRIAGPFQRRSALVRTPSYFSDWGSMRAFALEGMKVVRRCEAESGPYEWLYSRAHFAASHVLAALQKLSHPDIRWTAEFSDPLSRDVSGAERGRSVRRDDLLAELAGGATALGLPVPSSRNAFVWCEELTYVLADEIVFTNENQLAYMLGYCSNRTVRERVERKAVIMPQPSLPSRFYDMIEYPYELDRDQTNLAYFGNFYASRGPDDLLAAIAGLEADLRARLRLHLFTSRPQEVTARAQALGIGECVRANPYVKYLQFLGLAARFDCLIVNDALTGTTHAVNPYLPSKYADYHGSGAPVWGLVERGSPLSAERLAYTSPIGDVEAVRQTLRRMLDLPRET